MSSGTAFPPTPAGAADPIIGAESADRYPPGLIPPTQRRRSSMLIGDVIVDLGFARREAVDAAVQASREEGRTTGQILVESGTIRSDQLTRALAERFGVDYIDLTQFEADEEAMALLDLDTVKRYQAVPVGFLPDGTTVLAMADPTNVLTIDEVSMITGRRMRPAAAAREEIASLLKRYSRISEPTADVVEDEPEIDLHLAASSNSDAPVVKLVHQVVQQAIELGASDIHFDPTGKDMTVQFRIDGVLSSTSPIPQFMAASVVSRIKIMANLNIAERRAPQDGRMHVTVDGRHIDLRAATLPLVSGEGVVLRVLDTGAVERKLDKLGLSPEDRERFETAIAKPYGAVLVTGPTGSGKSTTLYGALNIINDGERSVLTIEDPVESPVTGIKQMQVAPKAGVTFAAGLRAILRADPDVIMVGEIRDRETAEIAIQAALTGHLMLSTLHTRDSANAMTRLVDMGVEPFMVGAAIDCVVAQRLARTLCDCKREDDLPDEVRTEHGLGDAQVFEPVGCMRCTHSGYRGRVGLYEVMSVTERVRGALLEHRGADEIKAIAIEEGMQTMRQDGIEKVKRGLTSIVEVGRVTAA